MKYKMKWTKTNGEKDERTYRSKKEMFEASEILKARTDIIECYWTDEKEEEKNIIIKKETKTKESTRKAIDKYNAKFDIITIKSQPGTKEALKRLAEAQGKSMTELINELIEKALN